ncbi:hypothetical protein B0F90DRAFT_1748888 [Multifurca ochricompacta]|uniref:Zinc-finger domain-containing protein n=1 Tax=Multifurca ochricompacta TaxID=376703 RepID=A0AAD4LZI5_9AGAM|nr:hypothetical protein B0F90DRAFT_1748888 [Multifurca ochricompacta]
MSMRPPSIRAQRTPLSSSKLHKLPEVYVLVPHSPYSQPFGTPEVINTHAPNSTLSPLTPLRAHNMTSAGPPSNLIKRKRSEENIDGTKKPVTGAAHTVTSNATPGFPNGFFYCHQCNKKRDSSVGLFCTYKIRTPNSVARCKAKYCRPCLKNRYGQDLDEIKDRGINALHKETAGHDKAQGYIFKCPRCLSNCNCRSCRKAVGLEPTGNLTSAAKRSGANSVAVMLDGDVKMTGILPGKGKQRRVFRPPRAPDPVPTATAPKLRMPVSRKPKPLPKSFTLERAMPRITIREFVIRFGKLFDMSRGHLEELEEIGGRRSHEVEGNNSDSEQDVDVEVGWVGETCLRSILVGFLGLLLDSQLELGGKQSKTAIQDAIQDIKASRANLNQMWGALAGLRAELKKEDPHRPIFPDPLPPPQRTKIHTTRSGALNGSGVNVTTTAQLVPVVLPLIEMALGTQAVRDELEEGAKKVKERVREEKELAKSTREQWERAKKNNSLVRFYSIYPDNQTEACARFAGQNSPSRVQTKPEFA